MRLLGLRWQKAPVCEAEQEEEAAAQPEPSAALGDASDVLAFSLPETCLSIRPVPSLPPSCLRNNRSGCSESCISALLLRGVKGQGNYWVCAQPPSSLRLSALLCFTLQGLVPLISACTSRKVPCGLRACMLSCLMLLWSP